MHRGLGASEVEFPGAGPRHLNEDAVEHLPVLFIDVEATAYKLAQEAPRLRHAMGVRVADFAHAGIHVRSSKP